MPGILLLDEEQQRELFDAQRSRVSSSRDRRRPYLLSNETISSDPVYADRRMPRTDFTSTMPQLRNDFRASDGYSKRADLPYRMDSGRDSYPMLRNKDSSTASHTEAVDGGEYAGTSSGLKISVKWIFVGLIVGIAVGMTLSETTTSHTTARWVSMPGDLFLRALKCLVVPYVFCSVAVAIGDIVFVGKVSVIGVQTAKIYGIFWVSTVALGVSIALMFRPFFRSTDHQIGRSATAMGFTCPDHLLATLTPNGSVACSTNATVLAKPTTFVVHDLNDVFAKNTNDKIAVLTLSDQIMQTILPLVSSNIIASLANGDLLSVITFSMVLGSIAGHSYFTRTRRVNYLYLVLLQLRNTFFLLMEWTIWLSPIAVVSIVAGTFANNPKFFNVLEHAYPYLLAALSAGLIQALFVYPLLIFLLTRCNPYSHMKGMVRAYMFAFACASSLGTMPVTLSCVKAAKMCSQSVANFVISIGVVASTSGMGFYLPIAIVFIAESSGNGDQITPLRIIGIFVLSLLTCAGTPPIPAAGLVVISTAYTTLFGEIPTTTFGYVAAMDFFFDRIVTACNVNDDIMALKIIAETTDETVAQDHLGERF